MKFAPHKRRRAPTVIIVSLIDVLLVVLIFLMVTTTFKRLEPALNIALPDSSQATVGASEATAMVVTIATNAPHLYLDGHPISLNELERALQDATERNPKVRVDVKSDKRAPVGELVHVMDAARKAKATLNVLTEKSDR